MSYGFGAFFGLLPGGDISSIMLIYGFPISLLGFALAYAQLKPVPCKTTKAAFDLREQEMTDIQKQVRPQQPGLISATSALSCLAGNAEHTTTLTAGMQLLSQCLRLFSGHSCRAAELHSSFYNALDTSGSCITKLAVVMLVGAAARKLSCAERLPPGI